MIHAESVLADAFVKNLLSKQNDHRLQVQIPKSNMAMDNSTDSNLKELYDIATEFVHKNKKEIHIICEKLMNTKE